MIWIFLSLLGLFVLAEFIRPWRLRWEARACGWERDAMRQVFERHEREAREKARKANDRAYETFWLDRADYYARKARRVASNEEVRQ